MQQPRHQYQNRNRYPQQQAMGNMMQPRHSSMAPAAGMPQPMPGMQHQMPPPTMMSG